MVANTILFFVISMCAISYGFKFEIDNHHFWSDSEDIELSCPCDEEKFGLTSTLNKMDVSTTTSEDSDEHTHTPMTERMLGSNRETTELGGVVTTLNIYQGIISGNFTQIVKNGHLLPNRSNMYSFDNQLRHLQIFNTTNREREPLTDYVCSCFYNDKIQRSWRWTTDISYVHIITEESLSSSSECVLASGKHGFHLAGEDLELRCNCSDAIMISFRSHTSESRIYNETVTKGNCSQNSCSYHLPNITMDYNNTELRCSATTPTGGRNLCLNVPTLFILTEFTVNLNPSSREIFSGNQNVTFTCSSNVGLPLLVKTIEWDVDMGFDAEFHPSETFGKTQLTIYNIRWSDNETTNAFNISCKMNFTDLISASAEPAIIRRELNKVHPLRVFLMTIGCTTVGVTFTLFLLIFITRMVFKYRQWQAQKLSPNQLINMKGYPSPRPPGGNPNVLRGEPSRRVPVHTEEDGDYEFDYEVTSMPNRGASHYKSEMFYQNV